MYYLYILHSEKYDKFYVGSSKDACNRLEDHNNSDKNTFTSKYRPWQIAALFKVGDTRSEAVRIERFIKQQKSRKLIEKLTDSEFVPNGILAQLVRVPQVRD